MAALVVLLPAVVAVAVGVDLVAGVVWIVMAAVDCLVQEGCGGPPP